MGMMKKMQIIIFGCGKLETLIEEYIDFQKVDIIAFADNNRELWDKSRILKCNKVVPVINPAEILTLIEKIDKIVVASGGYEDIFKQLIRMGVDERMLVNATNLTESSNENLRNIFVSNYYCQNDSFIIDGVKINLGEDACLAKYQRSCLMYDRFNKFLGKAENELSKNSKERYIIDIGANVGDTLYAFLNNTSSNIVAIEPAKCYFELLQNNVKNLGEIFRKRIMTVNAFISNDEEEQYTVNIHKGTAVKVALMPENNKETEAPTKKIRTVMHELGIKEEEVSLIKVDTDGYDYDCILSCGNMLSNYSPLLYWENYLETPVQVDKYNEMYEYLDDCGYKYFFVFDNYGNYVGKMNRENIRDLNNYLSRMNIGYSQRTFDYVDILACKENHEELCIRYINEYLNEYRLNRYL